jgi:glycosyltransferase involved in cell wall biosynthesis
VDVCGEAHALNICFYANVSVHEIERIEFYHNDFRILKELGHQVVIAESLGDVALTGRRADLFFVWWWNRAIAPIAIARLVCAPVVVCGVFDYFVPYPTKYDYVSRPAWQRWLMRTALASADANIFICRHELELVTRMLNVRGPRMIYLAVDGARYPCKTERPIRNRLLNIAWSGHENARRKGLFELIRAMPKILRAHPNAKLVMAGREGSAMPAMRRFAREIGVAGAVEFIGELTVEQKVSEMQRASLYIQPSMYEGFGSAVAEAMACGTPTACTLAGALPEVVGPAGVPIASGAADDIAQAVVTFLDLPMCEQEERGVRSASFVRQVFSYESRRDAISQVLSDVSKGSAPASCRKH